MSGEKHRVDTLELRKQLLIAESDVNRDQLLKDWESMCSGSHALVQRFKVIGSFTSMAALLAAGLGVFRRDKAPTDAPQKKSWFKTALKGAQVAGSLWLALRRRR